MENVMPSLVSEGKAITVLLIIRQQPIVYNNGSRLCGDIFRPVGLRRKNYDTVCIVENSHAQVDSVMGKELVILRHTEIALDKCFYINRRGMREDLRLEVRNKTIADSINFFPTQNRDTVSFDTERGIVHWRSLPLSITKLLDKTHPIGFVCIQITGGTQSG